MELSALYALTIKDQPKAIEWMQKATALEEKMSPPSGPPSLIKPTHELYGEILLRAGKPTEAAEQFKIALQRQPNRARSLLGAARAAAQSGNQSAAQSAYAALIDQWKQADTGLSELREARDYLKQAKR
jgi:predicted Zn-dependent protease